MMSEFATLSRDAAVATLTLKRPHARNALSPELLEELHQRVDELGDDRDARILVITGEGKAFCAGMDLKKVLDEPGAPARLLSSLAELTLKIRALPMATIAKVNGAAIGGGCGLMCVCDFAVSHPDAKLGFPEVDLGVCPAVVAPWLSLRVGPGPTRRILLEGGLLSGTDAFERGLLSTLVERSKLDEAVSELTGRLAAAGPLALRRTKLHLNELDDDRLPALVRRGALISAEVFEGEEAQKRLRAAFAESDR